MGSNLPEDDFAGLSLFSSAASAPFSHLTPGLGRERCQSPRGPESIFFASLDALLYESPPGHRFATAWLAYHDTEPWQHRLRCACTASDIIGAMGLVLQTTRKLRAPLAFLLCLAGQAADRDVPSRALIPGRVTGPGSILQLSYSHDGSSLGVLTTIGLQIRDSRSGALLKSIPHVDSSPRAFSWAPDGKRIALAAGSVEIWDLERGRCERALPTEPGDIFDIIRWSPDGNLIAAGSRHRMVVFDAVSGHRTEIPPPSRDPYPHGSGWPIGAFSWAPDGGEIAIVAGDWNTLATRIWDARTLKLVRTLPLSHRKPPRASPGDGSCGTVAVPISAQVDSIIEWAPDGQVLATFSPETGLSLWDAGTGLLRRRLPAKEATISLSWSPDSKLLHAGSYHEMRFLGAKTGSLEYSLVYPLHNKAADRVELSTVTTDGERQAAFYFGHGVIETWQGRQKAPGQRITVGRPVGGANLSPDMQKTIAGSSWTPAAIWDLETGTELVQLQHPLFRGDEYAWSPDAKLLAHALGADLQLVQATDGRVTRTFLLPKADIGYTEPQWSPDATRILVRNPRGDAVVSVETGLIEALPPGKGLAVWGIGETLAWLPNLKNFEALQSPDRRYAVVMEWPAPRVWNIEENRAILALPTGSKVAWSPDSRRIACVSDGDPKEVDVWDLAQAQIVERVTAIGARRLAYPVWHNRLAAIESLGGAMRLWREP